MHSIDLRSDTATRPSEGHCAWQSHEPWSTTTIWRGSMRRGVAGPARQDACQGNGAIHASGPMANQVALKTLTALGEEVIVGEEAHIV